MSLRTKTLVASACALAAVTTGLVSATSAAATTPASTTMASASSASSACSPTGCAYHLNVIYRTGKHAYWSTDDEWTWMVAARNADARAVAQESGVASVWLTDDHTGARVKSYFCATGARCDPRSSELAAGATSWNAEWLDNNCYGHSPTDGESEGAALRDFLTWAGQSYRGEKQAAVLFSAHGTYVLEEKAPHHHCL